MASFAVVSPDKTAASDSNACLAALAWACTTAALMEKTLLRRTGEHSVITTAPIASAVRSRKIGASGAHDSA
jgi:hypothetical protein